MGALGKFCNACQAIPTDGYCRLAGCPMARPDAFAGREFLSDGLTVICTSESGGNGIATAIDAEMADRIAVRLQTATDTRERLQAIIDWADFALADPAEFDGHGVRNLAGPVFDEARALLTELGKQA